MYNDMPVFLQSKIFMKNFLQMVVAFNLYLTIFKREYFVY